MPSGGLRDAEGLQTTRYMMSKYILPALDHEPSEPTDAQKQALLAELQLAEDSRGIPASPGDPTDIPQ